MLSIPVRTNYWKERGQSELLGRALVSPTLVDKTKNRLCICVCVWYVRIVYRPYLWDHFVLRHSLPDGKAHESPLAAVCTAVSRETWREVAFGSFDSPRPQTWWDCRKKVLNDRNGRWQLIVVLVEVSSLPLLPKIGTAGKSVRMVYLLGTELESLLHHGNPYCTHRPLPSFTAIWL